MNGYLNCKNKAKELFNKLFVEESKEEYEKKEISNTERALADNYIKNNYKFIINNSCSVDLLVIKANCLEVFSQNLKLSKKLYLFIKKNLNVDEQNIIANLFIANKEKKNIVASLILYIKDRDFNLKKEKFDNNIFEIFCTVFFEKLSINIHANNFFEYTDNFFELVRIFGYEFIKNNTKVLKKIIFSNKLYSTFIQETHRQILHVNFLHLLERDEKLLIVFRMKFWVLQNYNELEISQEQFYRVNELMSLLNIDAIFSINDETIKSIINSPDKVKELLLCEKNRRAFIENPNKFSEISIEKVEIKFTNTNFKQPSEIKNKFSEFTHTSDEKLLTIKCGLIEFNLSYSKEIYLYIKRCKYKENELLAKWFLNFPNTAIFYCTNLYEKKINIDCEKFSPNDLSLFEAVLKNCSEQTKDTKKGHLFDRTQTVIKIFGYEFVNTYNKEICLVIQNDDAYEKFELMIENYFKILSTENGYKAISISQWRDEMKFWMLLSAYCIENELPKKGREEAFANANALFKTAQRNVILFFPHDKLKELSGNLKLVSKIKNNCNKIEEFINCEEKNKFTTPMLETNDLELNENL